MKKNRVIQIIAITSILVIAFFTSLYVVAIKSEPYAFAVYYITHNQKVGETLGPLKSYRLTFLGYAVRYDGPDGNAKYKILVRGEKQKAAVYLYMEKSVGVWKIIDANMILDTGDSISLID